MIISPYRYKYLKEIKQLSKNLILFAPIQQQDDFAGYNVFLSKLNHGEFIIYGDKTKYIPFIVSLLPEEPKTEEPVNNVNNKNINASVQEVLSNEQIEQNTQVISDSPAEDYEQQISDNQIIQEIENDNFINPQPEVENIEETYIPEQESVISDESYQNTEQNFEQYDEVEQIVQTEAQEQYQTEDIEQIAQNQEEINESIRQDLDKMESIPASDVQPPDDSILTDDDLDFIQENIEQPQEFVQPEGEFVPPELQERYIQAQQAQQLQQQAEHVEQVIEQPQEFVQPEGEFVPPELQERYIQAQQAQQLQQQVIQNEQIKNQEFKETPIVPVYPAEKQENPASQGQFVQGDVVLHQTYGKGVVQKIISYGDKTLCSIDFESAGKKLLDPAITQLEKM